MNVSHLLHWNEYGAPIFNEGVRRFLLLAFLLFLQGTSRGLHDPTGLDDIGVADMLGLVGERSEGVEDSFDDGSIGLVNSYGLTYHREDKVEESFADGVAFGVLIVGVFVNCGIVGFSRAANAVVATVGIVTLVIPTPIISRVVSPTATSTWPVVIVGLLMIMVVAVGISLVLSPIIGIIVVIVVPGAIVVTTSVHSRGRSSVKSTTVVTVVVARESTSAAVLLERAGPRAEESRCQEMNVGKVKSDRVKTNIGVNIL